MRTLILLITIISYQFGTAQINPPSLNCIEGNGAEIEIFWTPPAAPCGAILGYEVFFSDQINGPYQSFTIADPSILDTTFATAFTEVFCFMQTTMNCVGQQVVNSDTLIWDLRPPIITSVSVNTANQIEFNWEENPSPDIAAYLIYVNGSSIPDTVYGLSNTTYVDLISDPSLASNEYEVAWFRDCVDDGDRRGSISDAYNSILLENLQQDKCSRSFTFGWNRYQNYAAGIQGYGIEVNINNMGFNAIDTVPDNQLIYLYPDAINNNEYCFRVNAILPNGAAAYSNSLCDSAEVVDGPVGAHIRNVTVIDNSTIHVEYFPDSVGMLTDLNFQRAVLANNDFQTWPSINIATSGTIPSYDTYEDIDSDPASFPFYYRFRRLDECSNEYITDSAKTIHLDADLGFSLSGELEWNEYVIANGVVQTYHIIKYTNGDSSLLASVSGGTTNFVEEDALSFTSLDSVCYQIIAEIDLDIPGLVNTSTVSQSNISCLNPTPKVIGPKAFKPSGLNNTFKPIIVFGTEEAYIFRVYDRWNRLLFETTNPEEGWDGIYKGQESPLDVYVYYVSFVGQDNNTYSKAGSVVLVR